MAADIAPELYEKISAAFRKKYEAATLYGEPIKNVEEILRKRTANFRDADLYATKVGAMLSEAMKEVMVLDELPNKTLYYNIAKSTIGSMLEDAYRMTTTVASVVQEKINGRAGIGMKPAKVEMSVRQLNEIVSRASNSKTQEQLNSALTEPVKTFPRKAVDNTIRTNAKVHSEAGLAVRVVRKYDGVGVHDRKDPCEWCLARAGAWTYPDAMAAGVFERHDGCGCIIDYTSKKGERTRSTDKWGFAKIQNPEKKEAALIKNNNNTRSNIIDISGKEGYNLFRNRTKALIDPNYSEPMTKRHVRRVMDEMGINYNGAKIELERDKALVGKRICGYTSPNGKSVTFYPDAFTSRETLVKTIGHERIHLTQIKERGPAKDSITAVQYEREAYASEDKWWSDYLNRKNR